MRMNPALIAAHIIFHSLAILLTANIVYQLWIFPR